MISPIGKHLDALYLSIKGEMNPVLVNILRALKCEAAETETGRQWVMDDAGIPGGPFWIQSRGTKGYEFVIRNHRLYLQLTVQKHLPALNIQFLAECLYEYDLDGLQVIVDRLCDFFVPEHTEQLVSRADFAVDFQAAGELPFVLPDMADVVTRARYRDQRWDRNTVQTLTLGQRGGALQVQIYNKSAEVAKSNKQWLQQIWSVAGYDPERPVWRAEVRCFRELLSSFRVRGIGDLRRVAGDILQYAVSPEEAGTWVRVADSASRGANTTRRGSSSWWRSVANTMLYGELFTGRRRLRPKALSSINKAMDMYLAWASRVAALARAGGLHDGHTAFGSWLHAYGRSHARRHKGKSWAELVNDQLSKLPDAQIEPYKGRLFDLPAVHLDYG